MQTKEGRLADDLEMVVTRLEFIRAISECLGSLGTSAQVGFFFVLGDICEKLEVIEKEMRCAA
jgi:hypothetical protein